MATVIPRPPAESRPDYIPKRRSSSRYVERDSLLQLESGNTTEIEDTRNSGEQPGNVAASEKGSKPARRGRKAKSRARKEGHDKSTKKVYKWRMVV